MNDFYRSKILESVNTSKLKTMSSQHIQLNIPLSFNQVVEIVKQLSPSEKLQLREVLQTEKSSDDVVIPEEHKEIVRKRIKKYENNPDSYLQWNEIENKMIDLIRNVPG